MALSINPIPGQTEAYVATGPAINPLASLVSSVSTGISQIQAEAQSAIPQIGNLSEKLSLDATVSRLGGDIGSPLNGMTGDLQQLGNTVTGTLSTNPLAGLQTLAGSTSTIAADISGTLNKAAGSLVSGVTNLLSGTSAGQLSDFLSQRRGANIPAGGELFESFGSEITLLSESGSDWRVRINCDWTLFNSSLFNRLESTGGVVWPYTPQITVSTKATYSSMESIHSNYPFQAYKNSQVDDIDIVGEFTCETADEAEYWIAATTFFKTATKMFFGQGENAGNPPIICNLTGYGSSIFDNVPVVVKSFSVTLPEDVNYIQYAPTNTWVPVVSSISVTVSPIYNRVRLRQFSLADYANGGMAMKSSGNNIGYI